MCQHSPGPDHHPWDEQRTMANQKVYPPVRVGDRFGRLVVLAEAEPRDGKRRWSVRCDCGTQKLVPTTRLSCQRTLSCGCLIKDSNRARSKHGFAKAGRKIPEYVVWQGMRRRCDEPSHRDYALYGGRGVRVCDRWRSHFDLFLADMGRRPSGTHSLDRYPNADGDYEPGNVRWATPVEQAESRRHTILVPFGGERLPLARVAERLGLPYMTLYKRIVVRGWPLARALKP